ncbi:MAG: hypothetical protein ACE5FF_00840 [Saprospiraceae bacterium]
MKAFPMIRLPFLIAVFFLLPAIGAYAQTTKMPCPVKEGDDRCGVTTYDLVLITKHILGVQPLGSPYKIIAADANK